MPDRKLRFGRAGSGPLRMSASGTEGGDGCGWWQAPVADRFANRLRPLCLADWYDVPSTFRHWGLIVVSPRSLTNTSLGSVPAVSHRSPGSRRGLAGVSLGSRCGQSPQSHKYVYSIFYRAWIPWCRARQSAASLEVS